VRPQAGDRRSFEAHLSAAGRERSGDHVEERRLPRAVGADDADDLPVRHLEREVGQGTDPAERPGDVAHLEERGGHLASLRMAAAAARRRSKGTKPSGMYRSTTTMKRPNKSRCNSANRAQRASPIDRSRSPKAERSIAQVTAIAAATIKAAA